MRAGFFPLAAIFAFASLASAAELPSRNADTKRPDPKARECDIGGERGVELAGGACMRISGYVSAGVAAGTIKH